MPQPGRGQCDSALDNGQEGKFKCSGDPGGAQPVQIVITKDADKISANPSTETINVGDLFTVAKNNGDKLASETKFDIRQGVRLLQKIFRKA